MSERECVDRSVGVMLHAYEVGGLAEEDIERFETHLLQCEGCFEAVRSFDTCAEVLRSDHGIREIVREGGEEAIADSGIPGWRQYLWPSYPWPFRPAVLYLLLLLLLYPAYRGLHQSPPRPVTPVQTITLIPSRSADAEGLFLQSGRDAAITFVFRGAVPGKPYQVRLVADDGHVLYGEDVFTAFDQYETGQLLFPAERMQPGGYLLEVTDPAGPPPQNRQAYRFEVRP
jgi:hypothetical protein